MAHKALGSPLVSPARGAAQVSRQSGITSGRVRVGLHAPASGTSGGQNRNDESGESAAAEKRSPGGTFAPELLLGSKVTGQVTGREPTNASRTT
jgi:hypothetical protein